MADQTEAEVIRDLADKAARWHSVEAGKRYAWLTADGKVGELDLSGELPPFRRGSVTVRDAESFGTYWDKHHDEESEVFADYDLATVTAVLDAHEAGSARHQQHRVTLKLALTEPWKAWAEHDRKMRPQRDFAEFLEDNRRDLAPADAYGDLEFPYVSAADFLEIAQHFQAVRKTTFQAGSRLASGDVTFAWQEDTTSSAGKRGEFTMPGQFALAIAPYDDCQRSLITARLRFHPQDDGQLKVGYFLDAPERVRRAAVEEIAGLVAVRIGSDLMRGTPA